MALIVLIAICFFACIFLLFVLLKWMRDAKRQAKTRPGVDNKVDKKREEKRSRVVDFRRAVERRDRSKFGAHRVPTITELSRIQKSWYERERIAYERIARSFEPGKRS